MVTAPCGSVWDETLTVGELVTAYRAGYHIITRFEDRSEYKPLGMPPIVFYVQVAKASGGLLERRTEYSCDASFVRRMTRTRIECDWADELEQAHRKRDNLLQFVPV
jgi:hypothetical protein